MQIQQCAVREPLELTPQQRSSITTMGCLAQRNKDTVLPVNYRLPWDDGSHRRACPTSTPR
ncbi:hypothetical protein, partial [Variovorax atrisoli]|uniref:hypothetical protein n=1 Tax=Variovorax atrisoli TaxID=3394203 RepID=UPI001A9E9345